MRVVVAPDKFAGTLSAVEAAAAIEAGWRRQAPGDTVVAVPMSDGGPGFVDVLHAVLGGSLVPVGTAEVLRVADTAYVEAARSVGHGMDATDPRRRGSTALGDVLAGVAGLGVRRIVVGVGGTATNDAGAGLLAALGASAIGGSLTQGPDGLRSLTSVDASAAVAALAGVELVLASDVDSPLTGLFGATKTYGPQKGLAEEDLPWVDGALQTFAALTDRRLATRPGAGAGGGIGFALQLLGATYRSGVELVAEAVGLADAVAGADLVVTGEGSLDFSSRAGKAPAGVAEAAQRAVRPCIVLAGQVHLGAREMRTMGFESAYSMAETAGEQRALSDPAGTLADLAARVARTWSR